MYSDRFLYDNLFNTYLELKKKKLTAGVDRITKVHFSNIAEDDLKMVSKKLLNETYLPTPYKEVLLVKSRNSNPRMLSLPTIRDKIVLEVIKKILKETCLIEKIKLPDLIEKISYQLWFGQFDSYLKLDIKSFYSNIDHNKLINILKPLINDTMVIQLIEKFLKNITISESQIKISRERENKKGVPQGISISNSLGEIYLKSFDEIFLSMDNCTYFRYVDDIFIFCNNSDLEVIRQKVHKKLKSSSYKLEVSKEKCEYGYIKPFDFLGYHFYETGLIGIASRNIHRIELSLEKIFSEFCYSHEKHIKNNIELLKWKLNYRITGCFKGGRRYGWVIFFCQNQVISTFYHLDWLIVQLAHRFNISNLIIKNNKYIGKHFVKTYFDFINKQDNSEYIPDVDNFTKEIKREVLINVCKRKKNYVNGLDDFYLDRVFDNFMFSTISEIEKDLYQIYT